MDCKSISPNLVSLTLLLSYCVGNIFPRSKKKDGLRDPNDDMLRTHQTVYKARHGRIKSDATKDHEQDCCSRKTQRHIV